MARMSRAGVIAEMLAGLLDELETDALSEAWASD